MPKEIRQWYRFENRSKTTAEIYIYDTIGEDFWGAGVSAKSFIRELNDLENSVDTIQLHINSPGGAVFDGNAIYNALRNHDARIEVTIDGIAASIASVIAMAGNIISMPENAMMMIHDPAGFAIGTAEDMRKIAEALDKIKLGIISSYREKTDQKDSVIEKMMTDETWMTADEAVNLGFADNKTEPVRFQANFDLLTKFNNTPGRLLAAAVHPQNNTGGPSMPTPTNTPPEITIDLIRAEHQDIINVIADEAAAAARTEGATAELRRIQDVQDQLIPGHENLINTLMWDGETTGPQAAVKILAAEKALRMQTLENINQDGTP